MYFIRSWVLLTNQFNLVPIKVLLFIIIYIIIYEDMAESSQGTCIIPLCIASLLSFNNLLMPKNIHRNSKDVILFF